MYFESLAELWHMAGHGVFVWSAYGISALVLAGIIVQPLLRFRLELKRLQTLSGQNDNPSIFSDDQIVGSSIVDSNAAPTTVEQDRADGQPGVKR